MTNSEGYPYLPFVASAARRRRPRVQWGRATSNHERKTALLLAAPLPLALSLAVTGARLPAEDEIAALEGVEFGRAGLDAEALGDHAPSLPPVGLVHVHDRVWRLLGHLAELEDHERVARPV